MQAYAALSGTDAVDAIAARQILASAAKGLARALPVSKGMYDPDLDGPPMTPEAIEAAAIDARSFLELIADLFGSPADPDWMGDDFAFSGALTKRSDWKPPAQPTAGQRKRQAAAARVYELMAAACFDTGLPPKQEAAIASAMQEFGMARSKVMQGLKEYRESRSWLRSFDPGDDGELMCVPEREKMARTHRMLASHAMAKEWFRRNPDAHFLEVPAGSALEKELLSRESPHDRQE
jgi:hypothetical protein